MTVFGVDPLLEPRRMIRAALSAGLSLMLCMLLMACSHQYRGPVAPVIRRHSAASATPPSVASSLVPNVVGMSVASATLELNQQGYEVHVIGKGDTVVRQDPIAGTQSSHNITLITN